MEESISSSRTSAALYGNSYDYCHYRYRYQPPAPAAAMAVASDSEDADSGWTAYFLQLASDEEDASPSREKQKLQDVGGGGRASASTVSKPKDNKAVLMKGVKKTKDVLVVGDRILEEEEDPLQDTASSPLLQPMQTEEVWSGEETGHQCNGEEVLETCMNGRIGTLGFHLTDRQ